MTGMSAFAPATVSDMDTRPKRRTSTCQHRSSTRSGICSSIVLSMPTNTSTEKVRENRMRRMAQRQGLQLHKSPRRDPRAYDYGRYMLIDMHSTAVVYG